MSKDATSRPKPGLNPPSPAAGFANDPAGVLRLSVRAMACDFGAVVRPDRTDLLLACGEALEIVPQIESWLSPWRSDSELSQLNACATGEPFLLSDRLYHLLQLAQELHQKTDGAFDITSGAQVDLWNRCRSEHRLPTEHERAAALASSGMHQLLLTSHPPKAVRQVSGLRLNPGAIGKGYALDAAASRMRARSDTADFLLHGGRSSLIAHGTHMETDGWPVGIGNPLLTRRRLGTVILRNQALSTSGSNIQFFRCAGRRFGHILDPRTSWPVEGMLSVTVLAASAAQADALSTAFFVLGVEKAAACCDTMEDIGAILIPCPRQGARVEPVVVGIPDGRIFWDEDLVALH